MGRSRWHRRTSDLDISDPAELAQFHEWREGLCDCEHGCIETEVMFDSDVLLEIKRELAKHHAEFPSLLSVFLDSLPNDGTVLNRTIISSADWRELDLLHAVNSGSAELNACIRNFGKGIRKLIILSGVLEKPIFFFFSYAKWTWGVTCATGEDLGCDRLQRQRTRFSRTICQRGCYWSQSLCGSLVPSGSV